MSHLPISLDIPNGISSLEADFGALPSDKPAGPTTAPVLPEVAPVLPSPQQVKELGLQTLVTSGLSGSGSSASAALQSFLENKSQQRLAMAGSTLFQENWKKKTTPLGRSYLEHTARARRTSDSACTSVPTPNTEDCKRDDWTENALKEAIEAGVAPPSTSQRLRSFATLATVPTPMAGNPATENYNAAGNNDYSRRIVELASVPTPNVMEGGQTSRGGTRKGELLMGGIAQLASLATPRTEDSQCAGAHRGTPDTLHSQANLAAVSTPSSRDWKDTSGMSESGVDPDGSTRSQLDQLPRQAQLADSGPTAIGGTDETASSGQLDPTYSRWLMGAPPEWDAFACTAMRSLSRKRKPSSKRT